LKKSPEAGGAIRRTPDAAFCGRPSGTVPRGVGILPRLAVATAAMAFACAAAQQPPETKFRMRARQKRYLLRERCLILWGSVRIKRGSMEFLADGAVVWLGGDGGALRLYAEGAVRLSDGKTVLEADFLTYDFPRRSGRLVNGRLHLPASELSKRREGVAGMTKGMKALFVRAATIRSEDDLLRFAAEDAVVSNCTYDEPHWGLRSRRIRLRRTGEMEAEGNSIFFGPVSLPLPPVEVERGWWSPLRRLSWGRKSDYGDTLLTVVRLADSRAFTLDLRYDRYSLRGDAFGVRVSHRRTGRRVSLEMFGIDDEGVSHGLDVPEGRRYRVALRARHAPRAARDGAADEDSTAETGRATHFFVLHYHHTSDEEVLRNFFPTDYRRAEPQRSFLLGRTYTEHLLVDFITVWRPETFVEETERLPEFAGRAFAIPAGPFRLSTLVRYGRLRRSWPDSTGIPPEEATRGVADVACSLPCRLGPVAADATVSGSAAEYSRIRDFDGPLRRSEASGRFSLSTLLWRQYPAFRHSVQPRVEYFRRFHLSVPSEVMVPFDETEAAEREHWLFAEVQNHIESGNRRLLSVSVGLKRHIERGAELTTWLSARPVAWLGLETRTRHLTEGIRLAYRSLKGAFSYGGVRMSVSEDYNPRGRHLLTASFRVDTGRWRPYVSAVFDLREGATASCRMGVTRVFHCFSLMFGIERDMVEHKYSVHFWLGPAGMETDRVRVRGEEVGSR